MRATIQSKAPDYFESDRSMFLSWIGGEHPSVLDVGCATGLNAAWLRARGSRRLVGVEPDRLSAEIASERFDRVLCAPIEEALPSLDESFDLIVCADVLEHLVDPWAVVSQLREVVAPHGRLAISIPNIRYYRALVRIAFGAGFRYEDSGTFDATHLRFFNRATLVDMVTGSGWRPVRVDAAHCDRFTSVVSRLTRRGADEWMAYEWFLLAEPS